MKGFPHITRENDHIVARFDNTLIDARPWCLGRAAAVDEQWPGVALQPLEQALGWLEGRHPLALAHYVNHPPAGEHPNVALAPFDLTLSDGARHQRYTARPANIFFVAML
jgi:hypothetical protein